MSREDAPPIPPVPMVPVSWGELLDKITILDLKARLIPDAAARANVGRELQALRDVAAPVMQVAGLAPLLDGLARVNAALWRIEDDIRVKEAQGSFDDAFVALARSVYRTNDERAALKRAINALLKSGLVEEKHHPASCAEGQVDARGPA